MGVFWGGVRAFIVGIGVFLLIDRLILFHLVWDQVGRGRFHPPFGVVAWLLYCIG